MVLARFISKSIRLRSSACRRPGPGLSLALSIYQKGCHRGAFGFVGLGLKRQGLRFSLGFRAPLTHTVNPNIGVVVHLHSGRVCARMDRLVWRDDAAIAMRSSVIADFIPMLSQNGGVSASYRWKCNRFSRQ